MSDLPVAAPDHAAMIRRALDVGGIRTEKVHAAARAALDALLAERQQDKEALAFYADPVSYENESPRHVRPVIVDGGARARAALAVEEDAEPQDGLVTPRCDGSGDCKAALHMHGCFADRGDCDHPSEHRAVYP